jgi:hypothetical protein
VENINLIIDTYNEHVFRFNQSKNMQSIDDFVVNDDKRISWSLGLKNHLVRKAIAEFDESPVLTQSEHAAGVALPPAPITEELRERLARSHSVVENTTIKLRQPR